MAEKTLFWVVGSYFVVACNIPVINFNNFLRILLKKNIIVNSIKLMGNKEIYTATEEQTINACRKS